MASQIPAVPRIVFTILEPISLVAGSFAATFTSASFIDEQIPAQAYSGHTLSPASHVVAQQLGNMYMLSALVGIALFTTVSEVRALKAYLAALWVADIGHLVVTMYGLGWEGTIDYASWNALTWGNIGATGFLCLTRTIYLLGFFGPDLAATPTLTKPKRN
ncbi:hypothetical protein TD95_001208 [Thielaviopsis punctulata]|uniref:DUF7704 domain-containing protein n=1 Tax=Thielaviopsis punctulata TaxID=72032 RepID=A0A0F4ZBR2_9PEZI|nr:hypothetical protein TD95_001208 [Thielaviopsis punctulata]